MKAEIEYLSGFKQFGVVLANVRAMRDEAIGEIANSSTDKIQQLAGKIVAYDELLRMTNADYVIKKTENLP